MKEWVLSQEMDKWSVKFDVRDLGRHLDTTFRGWSSTSAAGVRLVISRLVLIFALPLDFHGRIRVVRSMFLPAALHGIEASLLASDSLRKLRSSIRRFVWSRRQLLAGVGAVFSLLDGLAVCDPSFCVVWFRFRLLRRYLALWPRRLVGFIVFWRWWVRVALVMVLSIFSLQVLLRLVLGGILMLWLGLGLVYPCLAIWLALFSISNMLFLMLGETRLLLIFAVGNVFRGGPLLDVHGSLQLLDSFHVRERDKALVRSIMVGGVWNGLLLGRV